MSDQPGQELKPHKWAVIKVPLPGIIGMRCETHCLICGCTPDEANSVICEPAKPEWWKETSKWRPAGIGREK